MQYQRKWIDAYMDTAYRFAELSSAKRLKVGCIAVKDHRIISIGYNGTLHGLDNECEYEVITYDWRDVSDGSWSYDNDKKYWKKLVTKPEVVHAEENCLAKLARDVGGAYGATLFCTHAPCIQCAKLIASVGVAGVYFKDVYRNADGLDLLQKVGVPVFDLRTG